MKRALIMVLAGILLLLGSLTVLAAKESSKPVLQDDWTVERLAQENKVEAAILIKQLNLADTFAVREATLQTLGITNEQAYEAVHKLLVLSTEEKRKDWKLILLKFALWVATVNVAMLLLKRNLITPKRRIWLLAGAFLVFGVVLGSDPSPMGTVKDAIVLYGMDRLIFPPRLVAFGVFTLMVVLGNKLICGWGCQLGTLQDWLYQVSPVEKKVWLPFQVTNGIRIMIFVIFTIVVFTMRIDFIGLIDPFKVFATSHLTVLSTIFIAVLLVLSLFFYRPWCTLFCPFGLTGWLAEQFSWFGVRWDQGKCIQCGTCSQVCPTKHINNLLKGDRIKADCYSCAACLHSCPAKALRYGRGLKSETSIFVTK